MKTKAGHYPNAAWSAETRALWDRFRKENSIDDIFGKEMLKMYCDGDHGLRITQKVIDKEGMVILDPKGRRVEHPLLATQRGYRMQQRAAIQKLHLDEEPTKGKPGKPQSSSRF